VPEIIRTVKSKSNPYVMIDKRLSENDALSWEARGVMVYLLGKPDGWTTRFTDLVRRGPAGVCKMRRVFKELREHGHIRQIRTQDDKGHFMYETRVYEAPEDNPSYDGKPVSGKPASGQPDDLLSNESASNSDTSAVAEACENTPSISELEYISCDEDGELVPKRLKTKRKPSRVRLEQVELGRHFSELTDIPMPENPNGNPRRYKAQYVAWWEPMKDILALRNDMARAKRLVRDAIDELDNDGMTISSPKSILKTAIGIHGRNARASPEVDWFAASQEEEQLRASKP